MGYWKELSSLNTWPVIVRAHLLYEKPWAFWSQFFFNKDWMLINWMNFNVFFSTGYFRLVGLTTLLSFIHLFLSLSTKIPCTTGTDNWMKDLFLGLGSEWWNNWTPSWFQMFIQKLSRQLLLNTKKGRWQCPCLPNEDPWLYRPLWMPIHPQVSNTFTVSAS